jgi:hypothetical protein
MHPGLVEKYNAFVSALNFGRPTEELMKLADELESAIYEAKRATP